MRSLAGLLTPTTQLLRLISIATYSVLCSAPAGAAVSFLGGISYLLMRIGNNDTVAPVADSPHRI